VAEQRTRLGRSLSAPLVSMLAAAALAMSGAIPTACPAYDAIWDLLMPLAASLLMLETDLSRCALLPGACAAASTSGRAAGAASPRAPPAGDARRIAPHIPPHIPSNTRNPPHTHPTHPAGWPARAAAP
jgi:hypothetical protein